MPPLRERTADIPLLTNFLLQQISGELKLPALTIHADALQQLLGYSFPGNVRELRNLLERACILNSGTVIRSIDLPRPQKAFSPPLFPDEFNLRQTLADWERDALIQTLAKTQGGKAETARRLGLSKSDITYKLAKYGITNADDPLL